MGRLHRLGEMGFFETTRATLPIWFLHPFLCRSIFETPTSREKPRFLHQKEKEIAIGYPVIIIISQALRKGEK